MTFAELLREYIGDRTLEEVVEGCAANGVQIDAPYLSRMRNGTRLPPSEDRVVSAIAAACERDTYPLLLLAYYERNPQKVLEYVIDSFVRLRRKYQNLYDVLINERVAVEYHLQMSGDCKSALQIHQDNEQELVRQISDWAEADERLTSLLELISDKERLQIAEPGSMGTLYTRTRKIPSVLVNDLAQAVEIPPDALWAYIASIRLLRQPLSNIETVIKELKDQYIPPGML